MTPSCTNYNRIPNPLTLDSEAPKQKAEMMCLQGSVGVGGHVRDKGGVGGGSRCTDGHGEEGAEGVR
jgi:hypothetical protein